MKLLLAAIFCFVTHAAMAARYEVDAARSELAFSGTNSGKPFRGVFEQWKASIDFDAAKLADSHINVFIKTASAKTGEAMIDSTLPLSDWFDAGHFPEAKFLSSAIHKNADGSYKAIGTLTIFRNRTQPISFEFTLTPSDANVPEMQAVAKFSLKRLNFAIGTTTDPEAKWVGDEVGLEVKLVAARNSAKASAN